MLALEFTLDHARYAVPADRVMEVLQRVRVTPLPGVSPVIEGVMQHRGRATLVVSLRTRFGLASRVPSLSDHFVVVQRRRGPCALIVDHAVGLLEVDASAVQTPSPASPHLLGVVTVADGVVLIEDIDAALSLDEEREADRALASREALR